MEEQGSNGLCEGVGFSKLQKLAGKSLYGCGGFGEGALFWFDDDDWSLLSAGAKSDEGGAVDAGVLIEDGFAADGVHWCVCSVHDMCFSATEPESVVFIEVSDISHAMPEGVTV